MVENKVDLTKHASNCHNTLMIIDVSQSPTARTTLTRVSAKRPNSKSGAASSTIEARRLLRNHLQCRADLHPFPVLRMRDDDSGIRTSL